MPDAGLIQVVERKTRDAGFSVFEVRLFEIPSRLFEEFR